jgi:hypothetical protein
MIFLRDVYSNDPERKKTEERVQGYTIPIDKQNK